MELYETLTLTPTVSPETAQVSYLWKSSSKKVAVVENGVVTPMSAGTATITCTAIRGSTKKTASMKVKVVNPYKLTEVRFQEKGTQTIAVGDTLELSAYPLPAFTYIRETSWKSSADQIARVSDGVVTALSVGEATITVSMSGGGIRKSASIRVRVVDPTRLDKIELHKSGTVVLGLGKETELVSYSLTPGVPDVQVRWESSDTKVATVREDGLVIPVAYGTATITATAVQGEIRRSASYQVKVVDPDNAYSIKILNGSQEPITKTKIGIPNYEVFYVEVLPRCATQTCGLQWSVSNRRIRLESGNSLDESHVRVYALQEGDAKLTVKASNGKSDSVAITTVKP